MVVSPSARFAVRLGSWPSAALALENRLLHVVSSLPCVVASARPVPPGRNNTVTGSILKLVPTSVPCGTCALSVLSRVSCAFLSSGVYSVPFVLLCVSFPSPLSPLPLWHETVKSCRPLSPASKRPQPEIGIQALAQA